MISECRKSNDFTVCTGSKNLSKEPSVASIFRQGQEVTELKLFSIRQLVFIQFSWNFFYVAVFSRRHHVKKFTDFHFFRFANYPLFNVFFKFTWYSKSINQFGRGLIFLLDHSSCPCLIIYFSMHHRPCVARIPQKLVTNVLDKLGTKPGLNNQ